MTDEVQAVPGQRAGGDAARPGFHAALSAGLPEAVLVADPAGRITFANAAAVDLFGYPLDDLVGESLLQLVPRQPGRRADVVQWLSRWAAESDLEQARFLDLEARRADGEILLVEVRVRAGAVDGEARYFLSVRDMTVRRREQQALKDSYLRALRTMLLAEDAVISIDAGQTITFFNPSAERLFGYSIDEVLGKPLAMLLPPDVRDAHPRHVEAFQSGSRVARMMGERSLIWGIKKSGARVPLEAAISKVTVGGSQTFTAQLRDVTDRLAAQENLEEGERRIRAVFDNASDALALLDASGVILEINHAGEALAPKGQARVGRRLWETPWFGSVMDAPTSEAIQAALGKAAMGERQVLQLQATPGAGPFRVTFTPIRTDDRKAAYILAEGREG